MCLTSFQFATANVSKDRPPPYFLTLHLGTHALITLSVKADLSTGFYVPYVPLIFVSEILITSK